jgi:hypothetical protein
VVGAEAIQWGPAAILRCQSEEHEGGVRWLPAWEWVAGQLPVGKNMGKEAEDSVGICHQATTGEDIADWEDLVHTVVNCSAYELAVAL